MAARREEAGFTLIETLAAMAVIATMMAIVLPNLTRGLDRSGIYAARIGFVAELQALRRQAFREARDVVVTAPGGGGAVIPLEPGWTYVLSGPLRIDASGRCSGGEVLLRSRRGLETRVRLEAPKCTEAVR
jgi:prepilin-type N-terminal cleavage/methylation domain-containing protein